MFPGDAVDKVSSAVIHYLRTPIAVILAVFVLIVVVTAALAVHEIKNDPE